MTKVVVNRCWGGFGLSDKALQHMGLSTGIYCGDIERTDPKLIAAVEELGEEANGSYSNLRIVYVPDDVSWYIDDYDGQETVRENHRTW